MSEKGHTLTVDGVVLQVGESIVLFTCSKCRIVNHIKGGVKLSGCDCDKTGMSITLYNVQEEGGV